MIQTAEVTFNLNEIKLPTIICRNEETGRQIQFTLVDDSGEPVTLPSTATYTFMMIKPDGNFYETLLTSGLLTVSDQLTASGGLGHYAIKITDTDTLIYSGQGGILIDDHLITDDTIDSVSEVYGLHFPDDFLTIYSSVAVLDDTTTSTLSTWSSSKIAAEIASGTGADLIDDNVTSADKTWSSNKISAGIAAKTSINDNGITHTETWSSDKIATELNGKPDVDDSAQNYSDTWSSEKINSEIQAAGPIDDNRTSDETTWSSRKISDEISAITPGGSAYSTTEHAIGTWIDGSTVYERTYRYTGNVPANPFQTNLDFTGKQVIDFIPHYAQYTYDGGSKTGIIVGSELLVNNSEMLQVQYNPEPPTLRVYSWLGNATESYDIAFTLRYTKTV